MKIALFSPALSTLAETTLHRTLHNSLDVAQGRDCPNQVILPSVNSPYEDWFNQGKADAWAGAPKSSPDHDPQAASFYDLGYDEGVIQKSPL